MNRSFAPDYGSAVIPAGNAILDPNWLVDELELRLTRCDWGLGHKRFRTSPDMLFALAQSFHRTADAETSSWWADHDLADVDERIQRDILKAMFERNPRQLGWAVVTLLGHQGAHLLDASTIRSVIGWVSDTNAATRFIRDGVALTLVATWLNRQPEKVALSILTELCQRGNVGEIRVGLMAGAAYLRNLARLTKTLGQTSLELCKCFAARTDAETASAVGWLLRELLSKDESRYFRELLGLCHVISRQALRTAVERMPREKRLAALSEWRHQRRLERARATAFESA